MLTATALLPRRLGLLLLALVIGEALAVSLIFEVDRSAQGWQDPIYVLRQAALAGFGSAAAFAVLMWPRRTELAALVRQATDRTDLRRPLRFNLLAFVLLAAAAAHVSASAVGQDGVTPGQLILLAAPLVLTAVSFCWIAAPGAVWRGLILGHAPQVAIALCAGAGSLAAAEFTRSFWDRLAEVTLGLSARILRLYEADVIVDMAEKTLQIGAFRVHIDAACSGYEGVGLVLAFLTVFVFAFRETLRFPHVLLVYPVGVISIWLLNSVRIAVLVSLGAHVSPDLAVKGFHSQAGWMSFLAVTVGLMAASLGIPLFRRTTEVVPRTLAAGDMEIRAFLAPFIGLMAASIVIAASEPFGAGLYGLKVLAVGAALVLYRRHYGVILARPASLPLAAGVATGIAWIATAPDIEGTSRVADLLAGLPLWMAILWIVTRAAGAIIFVPIAEELAFRGVLYRWIVSRRFDTVPFTHLSWTAVILSSLLFGLLHDRWIAGALAGVVFALVMVMRGRLSDAITAHVTANAMIVVWAVVMQDWALL